MPERCHGSGRFPTHLITTVDNGYHLLHLCGLQPVDLEAQLLLIPLATLSALEFQHSCPKWFSLQTTPSDGSNYISLPVA